jgi:hypothetical protein
VCVGFGDRELECVCRVLGSDNLGGPCGPHVRTHDARFKN